MSLISGCALRCSTSTHVNLTLASSQIFKLADVACFVGWAFEAVGSRLRFRCLRDPRNCKSSCIVVSLHCQNAVAEKRSIALNVLLAVRTAMVQDDADIVAADLRGASWRRKGGTDQPFDRIREVAFKKTQGFLCHLALHFCGVLEECQVKGQTCGLLVRPPMSQSEWLSRKHQHLKKHRQDSGLTHAHQTCHHQNVATSVHLWLKVYAINVTCTLGKC